LETNRLGGKVERNSDNRILGMTKGELIILVSLVILILCVIFFILFDLYRSYSLSALPLTSTPELLIQPTDSPLPVKYIDTPIPLVINTLTPTYTLTPTETPSAPISITYEGVSLYCTCTNCICIMDLLFKIRLTIDTEGNVTGTFEKYLADYPAIELKGVKSNIIGSVQDDKGRGNYNEFIGKLSENLRTLDATISFRGPDGTGKRELLFTRK
jgi:hypothetical protein